MANPQPVPFVRFSKELFEAYYLNPPATVAAGALWLWVLRWTWADFGKDETAPKPLRVIADELGMDKSTVHRELESLVRSRRLVRGPKGGYAIQKDYDLWRKDGWKRKRGAFIPAIQMSLGIEVPAVPTVGTNLSPRMGQDRPPVGDKPVPTVGTAIRSKNTVENREGARSAPRSKLSGQLPNGNSDTARNRAALGSPEFAPEGAPDFAKLTFKIKDELNDAWKANTEKALAKTACRKKCGRQRASEKWAWCRECTRCSECDAKADGGRQFTARGETITCSACAPEPVKSTP